MFPYCPAIPWAISGSVLLHTLQHLQLYWKWNYQAASPTPLTLPAKESFSCRILVQSSEEGSETQTQLHSTWRRGTGDSISWHTLSKYCQLQHGSTWPLHRNWWQKTPIPAQHICCDRWLRVPAVALSFWMASIASCITCPNSLPSARDAAACCRICTRLMWMSTATSRLFLWIWWLWLLTGWLSDRRLWIQKGSNITFNLVKQPNRPNASYSPATSCSCK